MQCLFYSVAHAEAPNHTWAEDAPAAGATWFYLQSTKHVGHAADHTVEKKDVDIRNLFLDFPRRFFDNHQAEKNPLLQIQAWISNDRTHNVHQLLGKPNSYVLWVL